VKFDDLLVDASTAYLVRDPSRFDVIVATNFYGDILSDLASELSGSLGLGGSVMAGDNLCCAQAQHGSAPDIQGQDKANPTSMILSVAMLVQWLGEHRAKSNFVAAAAAIDAAVDKVLTNPATRTADLGGTMSCAAFGKSVAESIAKA
jgi:3-isopropylmalate dehydrogenase